MPPTVRIFSLFPLAFRHPNTNGIQTEGKTWERPRVIPTPQVPSQPNRHDVYNTNCLPPGECESPGPSTIERPMRLVGLCTTILYKVLGFLAEAFPKHLPREPPRCNPPEQKALRSRVSWLFYSLSNPVRIFVHTKQPSGSLFLHWYSLVVLFRLLGSQETTAARGLGLLVVAHDSPARKPPPTKEAYGVRSQYNIYTQKRLA